MTELSDRDHARLRTATGEYRKALGVLATVRWRLGGSHKRNVYAEAGFSDGKPGTYAGHMDTDELAAAACDAHNAMLDLSWLLADGWLVEAGRSSADREDGMFFANLRRPGDRVSVHFSAASPGEALGKARAAREWAGQEGIAP